ncbi:MAG: hypothetical protein HYW62_00350, partial [Candidatus Levybacteria bacterium]|nr:hypothetical protein [Candidatus Levybacteria bacterium]
MSNQEIAKLFKNIAAAYSIKDERKFYFQRLAYQKASETIASLTTELKDLYREGKLDTAPGIGVTIKSRLTELFKKGSVSYFDSVLKGIPPSVFALIDIPSIGPKKAYKLTTTLRLNDSETVIKELLAKAKKHEIAKIPSFGEKSEQDIVSALLEYKEGKGKTTRMVLPYAGEISEKILSYLKNSPAITKAVPLGSLRRMMP